MWSGASDNKPPQEKMIGGLPGQELWGRAVRRQPDFCYAIAITCRVSCSRILKYRRPYGSRSRDRTRVARARERAGEARQRSLAQQQPVAAAACICTRGRFPNPVHGHRCNLPSDAREQPLRWKAMTFQMCEMPHSMTALAGGQKARRIRLCSTIGLPVSLGPALPQQPPVIFPTILMPPPHLPSARTCVRAHPPPRRDLSFSRFLVCRGTCGAACV